MNVRRAKTDDVCGVWSIEKSFSTTPQWTRGQFESELGVEASIFLVAEESGRLAGFAVARLHPPHLKILDIAAAVPRQGAGRALLEALKGEAEGCDVVTLEVSAENAAARAFYAAQGFRVVGLRPKFYNGADAILMDLALP